LKRLKYFKLAFGDEFRILTANTADEALSLVLDASVQ
jgi:hypothetical protein